LALHRFIKTKQEEIKKMTNETTNTKNNSDISCNKEEWQFPAEYLASELRVNASHTAIIRVQGDSMSPTLLTGDHVMINTQDNKPMEGLFAIDEGTGIAIKRLMIEPNTTPVSCKVSCDNKNHTSYITPFEDIDILGRVVCLIRKL
jgi:phage repressor protein C with HTH and peptisase S24 domain